MATGQSSRPGRFTSINGCLRYRSGIPPVILCFLEFGMLANNLESTSADPNHKCLFQHVVPLRMRLDSYRLHRSPKADIMQENGVELLLRLRGGVSLSDTNVNNHGNVSGTVSQDSLEGDLGMEDDDSLTDDELLSLGRQCHTNKDFSGAATYFSQLVERQVRKRQSRQPCPLVPS